MVIEGTLGLTAFNFIVRYLEREALLAGFVEGYSKIHHDEQRHIGYGTWFLQQAVRETSRPSATTSARRFAACCPRWRRRYPAGPRGHRLGGARRERGRDRDFAVAGLSRRLNIVGVPLDSL